MKKIILLILMLFSVQPAKAQLSPRLIYNELFPLGNCQSAIKEVENGLKGKVKAVNEVEVNNGKKVSEKTFKLNPFGKVTESTQYAAGAFNDTVKIAQKFDKKNRLIKYIVYADYRKGTPFLFETYNYDLNNNLINRMNMNGSGEMFYDTLSYNNDNRIIEERQWRADNSTKINSCYTTYAYQNNRPVAIVIKHTGKVFHTANKPENSLALELETAAIDDNLLEISGNYVPGIIFFKVNENREVRLKFEYNENGDIVRKIADSVESEYTFNDKKELINVFQYHVDGGLTKKLIKKVSYEYSDGYRHRETSYTKLPEADSIAKDSVIEFNKKGRQINVETLDPSATWLTRDTSLYSANGTIISYHKIENPIRFDQTIKYNKNGDVVEDITYNKIHPATDKSITTYDTHGNWIKRVISHVSSGAANEDEIKTYYRTIVYYEDSKIEK